MSENKSFYQQTWFAWLMIFLFAPLGIFLMWKYKHHNIAARVVVSSIFGFYCLMLFIGLVNYATMTPEQKEALRIEQDQKLAAEKATKEAAAKAQAEKKQEVEPKKEEPQAEAKKEEPKKEEPKKEEKPWIKQGMYKVGKDLTAGEYVLFSDSKMAYYQVAKDSSGELASIISNDNFNGSSYITLSDNQYLEFRNAKMLPVSNCDPIQPQDGKYTAGMYKVGKDIPAGEYKVIPDGAMSYIEVLKDSKRILNSIVSNDNFTAEKYITIKDGQYIKLVNCYIQK